MDRGKVEKNNRENKEEGGEEKEIKKIIEKGLDKKFREIEEEEKSGDNRRGKKKRMENQGRKPAIQREVEFGEISFEEDISPLLQSINQSQLEEEVAGVPVSSENRSEGENLYSPEYEGNYEEVHEGYRGEEEIANTGGPGMENRGGRREIATEMNEPGMRGEGRPEYEVEAPERERADRNLGERERE